jgi:molybdate transport system regulatory protein
MRADNRIWLKQHGSTFAAKRIRLLEKIDEAGSISKASAAVGMSYKAAWDAIDKMNNLAEEPLVTKVTGGRSGGGSTLTDYARELIKAFYELEEAQDRTLEQLQGEKEAGIGFFFASTKNLFSSHVVDVKTGEVNASIGIRLRGEDQLSAIISKTSVERLQLKEGDRIYALVPESAISLLKGDGRELAVSARNRLLGRVGRILSSGVSAEVEIDLPGGQSIYMMMTADSVDSMDLRVGETVTALFKAQSVMILK